MKIVEGIERLINWVGERSSYLNFVLVVLICVDVLLRYLFSFSKNWILELEWHFFAIIFLLGSAYALQHDKHVRVDVFYQKFSDKTKAWINLLGTVLFLIPWSYVVLKTSASFALNSWYMKEGSPNPGGLPARYVIKSMIVIGFVLLVLQGIALLYRQIKTIRS